MKSVLKCLFVFALAMLVIVSAFIVLALAARQTVLFPILSGCMLLAVGGYVALKAYAIYTKRHTTATGFG